MKQRASHFLGIRTGFLDQALDHAQKSGTYPMKVWPLCERALSAIMAAKVRAPTRQDRKLPCHFLLPVPRMMKVFGLWQM